MPSFVRTILVAILLTTVVAFSGCRNGEEQPHDGAPDFTLPTLEEDSFTLSDFRGQVVLLNFWATWCGPCIVEIPHLVELQDELADHGLLIAGISQDTGPDAEADVRAFAERLEINYPILFDSDFSVSTSYGVHMLPTTLAIDREGRVHAQQVGLLTRDDMFAMIEDIIDLDNEPADAEPVATLPSPARQPTERYSGSVASTSVSVDDAADLFASGAMVVDLREETLRMQEGGIPYALEIVLEELDHSLLPANFGAPILFVGVDEAQSERAAEAANSWGYVQTFVLSGGFSAWAAAGLPVVPVRLGGRQPTRG